MVAAWVAERVDARDLKCERGDLAGLMPSHFFLLVSTTWPLWYCVEGRRIQQEKSGEYSPIYSPIDDPERRICNFGQRNWRSE